jgi:TnpA family transposase
MGDTLGFQLLPRLKAIHKQRLRLPDDDTKADTYKNLMHVLTRSIRWDLIRQQYDQMVIYATALRWEPRTLRRSYGASRATTSSIRHTRLAGLGKAVKTIFHRALTFADGLPHRPAVRN